MSAHAETAARGAPGTRHHVMGRGSVRTKRVPVATERADVVTRFAALCQGGQLVVYAWALIPIHLNRSVRTGTRPLARRMKRLLTGSVANFNRKHTRTGHLLQNQCKSIVVEEDSYLMELTRYIHLNPVRGRLVPGVQELRKYPWTGHAAILGVGDRAWQNTATVLAAFGQQRRQATQRYEAFVREGVGQGRRPELVGGGLIRSLGGWAQVLALRRKGSPMAADPRILGSGEFVEQLLSDAASREKETLRLTRKVINLTTLGRRILAREGTTEGQLRSGVRTRKLVRARRLFCQLAVQGMGYSGAEVARFLGVSTSALNRSAVSDELPEVKKYLKAF